MSPVVEINKVVDVTVLFRHQPGLDRVMPMQMHYHGRDIHFAQLGLCHTVRHGQTLCYIFDMSDGLNDYSLEFNTTTLTWTLLSIIAGGSQ